MLRAGSGPDSLHVGAIACLKSKRLEHAYCHQANLVGGTTLCLQGTRGSISLHPPIHFLTAGAPEVLQALALRLLCLLWLGSGRGYQHLRTAILGAYFFTGVPPSPGCLLTLCTLRPWLRSHCTKESTQSQAVCHS